MNSVQCVKCSQQSKVCSVRVVNQFPSSGSSSNLSICETAAGDLQTRNNPEFYLPRGILSLFLEGLPCSETVLNVAVSVFALWVPK